MFGWVRKALDRFQFTQGGQARFGYAITPPKTAKPMTPKAIGYRSERRRAAHKAKALKVWRLPASRVQDRNGTHFVLVA